MEIRFSDTRPSGDFALVLPSAGTKRPGLDSIGGAKTAVEAVLKRNRFDGESGAVVEHFVEGEKGGRLHDFCVAMRRQIRWAMPAIMVLVCVGTAVRAIPA